MIIDGLILLDSRIEGYIHNFIIAYTNHHIALPVEQSLDTGSTHTAGNNAVVSCRTATALQVSKDRYTYIKLRELIAHTLSIVQRATQLRVLRYEYDTAVL